MEMTPGKLWGLRRMADPDGTFRMLAADQRPPLEELVSAKGRGPEGVTALKRLLVSTLGSMASAVLVDPQYAFPDAVEDLDPRRGLLLTLEDSTFDDGPGGRRSAPIPDWTVGKIRRAGADAVKVLAWYRPDAAPEVKAHQEAFVADIGGRCRRFDVPFVLELLHYPFQGGDDREYREHLGKRAEHVVAAVERFADERFGVDLFKLESPLPAGALPPPDSPEATDTQAWFDRLAAAAGRPWVVLSAGAGPETFVRALTYACRAGASGFLAGRAIWWQAVTEFPDLEAVRRRLVDESIPYLRRLSELTARLARPWPHHPRYGSQGPRPPASGAGFRRGYADLEGM